MASCQLMVLSGNMLIGLPSAFNISVSRALCSLKSFTAKTFLFLLVQVEVTNFGFSISESEVNGTQVSTFAASGIHEDRRSA